jgi:integrase
MGRPANPLGTFGSITITRYGDGYRARCRYRDYDGVTRPVERHARSKAAAERKLKQALRDRVHVGGVATLSAESRFAELAEAWYAEIARADRSPTTLEAYRGCLDRHVLPSLGAPRICEVSTGIVDRLLKTLVDHHGPGSAKMARSVLSGCCGLACRLDVMERNPVREVSAIRRPRKKRDALDIAQGRQFLAYASYHDLSARRDLLALIFAMIGSGMRVGEACALCWDAVDLERGVIEIRGTTVRLKGRGTLVKPTPKSAAGQRYLRLPSWLVALLRERSSNPRDAITEIPLTDGGVWHSSPVFPAEHGQLRDRRNTSADIKDLFEFCGLDATSHMLRRSVASIMDDAGLSAKAGADQLGHAHASMTIDGYWRRGVVETGAAGVLEALA